MSIVITRTGQEPGIREAMDYLERRYGIPARDIRAVTLTTEVGQPVQITVTVYQQVEEGFTAEPYAVLCVQCGHQDFLHWDETPGSGHEARCVGPGPGRACPCNRSSQVVTLLAGEDIEP